MIFGCMVTNTNDDRFAPPLALEKVGYFQQLDAALKAHPNKLTQTTASLSSDQIWNFRSTKGQEPLISALKSFCMNAAPRDSIHALG